MARGRTTQSQPQKQQQKKQQMKVLGPLGKEQLPGRHPCSCQARMHALVRNCLSCGKIVCAQEGSGPCFFCGALVCTKEEKEVLDRNSRKSAELYKQLMGKDMPEGGLSGVTLSNLAAGMANAYKFRDTLLEADADCERRTRVNDLQSDFDNVDSNPFLSPEERDAIIRRREELRLIREKRRRALVVDINFASNSAEEQKQNYTETDSAYDPVIRQILDRSEERRRNTAMLEQSNADEAQWKGATFVPRYIRATTSMRSVSCEEQRAIIDQERDRMIRGISGGADERMQLLGKQGEEAAALEVERQGYAISMRQPLATLAANGLLKYLRWPEDPMLVGPIFVCAAAGHAATKAEVAQAIEKYKLPPTVTAFDYGSGSVQGRCYLAEVMTVQEYEEEVGPSKDLAGSGKFVLRFSYAEALLTSIPHVPPSDGTVYRLDPSLKAALSQVFSS